MQSVSIDASSLHQPQQSWHKAVGSRYAELELRTSADLAHHDLSTCCHSVLLSGAVGAKELAPVSTTGQVPAI